jgi:hypothetical protein
MLLGLLPYSAARPLRNSNKLPLAVRRGARVLLS